MKPLIMILLLTLNAWAYADHHHEDMNGGVESLNGESIYNLDSAWTNQDGKKIHLGTFRKSPVVLVMLYTSCREACPILIEDAKKIAADLGTRQREQTQFVVVSLDPVRDTAARLKIFGGLHHLNSNMWTLLHGNEKQIRELANSLGVKFKRDTAGDYSHSNIISIIDPDGVVRYQQQGLGTSDQASLEALRKM